jgi:hypothetical protein
MGVAQFAAEAYKRNLHVDTAAEDDSRGCLPEKSEVSGIRREGFTGNVGGPEVPVKL